MRKILRAKYLLYSLAATIISGYAVNGNLYGARRLRHDYPGIQIPDLIFSYPPEKLYIFFQNMGEAGRQQYLLLNSLDFLFIASYVLFGYLAIGILLKYVLRHKESAYKLAFLGMVPGIFDLLESTIFRFVVLNPYKDLGILPYLASFLTTAKFVSIFLGLFALLLLSGLATTKFYKSKH